jgi:hypothetical protein
MVMIAVLAAGQDVAGGFHGVIAGTLAGVSWIT